jgi:hypothetical protein
MFCLTAPIALVGELGERERESVREREREILLLFDI